jgi:Putative Actinobacterial Holin-X, holin superfamily III
VTGFYSSYTWGIISPYTIEVNLGLPEEDERWRRGERSVPASDASEKLAVAAETTQNDQQLRERSVPELVRQLSEETSTLVRQEIDLAKAELAGKARRVGVGAGALGAAAVVALYAVAAASVAVIAALALVMPVWGAAVVVAGFDAILAGALGLTGRRRLTAAMPPTPEATVDTVKEDVRWARNRWRFGRR